MLKPCPSRADGTLVSSTRYALGTTALDARTRRVLRDEKVVAYGGTAAKPQKMPLKMILGIRRAEAKRADRAAAERRASGVVAPTTAKQDAVLRGTSSSKGKATKRKDLPLDDVRDGVLRVDAALLGKKKGPGTTGGSGGKKKTNKKRAAAADGSSSSSSKKKKQRR